MKTRQIELLHILLNHQVVDLPKVLYIYNISKRTLFYDLEGINYHISHLGKIKVENNNLVINGNLEEIEHYTSNKLLSPFLQSQERKDIMLLSILDEKMYTLDDFVEMFRVSKSTVFSDIELLRADLLQRNVTLEYNKGYFLKGSEWEIRDIFLSLLSLKTFNYELIDENVLALNELHNLKLSDYSMFYLSELVRFVKYRNRNNHVIDKTFSLDVQFHNLDSILKINIAEEINYISAYILSLSTMTNRDDPHLVRNYVAELLREIKVNLLLDITWNEPFISNFENHLTASFFRIKYGFPAINHALKDIKVKYFYLFINIKRIIESLDTPNVFYKMRDEEIGFVVAYIGGYLYDLQESKDQSKRVVLVCPQGRVVSLNLRNQIEKSFEDVKIVGTYSINQLGNIAEKYDYIISTMDLPIYKNVIKINPILSKLDIDRLAKIFGPRNNKKEILIDEVLTIVNKYTFIEDEQSLRKELTSLLDEKRIKKERQPLLKEIISKDRIQVIDTVTDWKEAISLSSKPLLNEGIIQDDYVDAMINAVEEYGPYIVLADEFALPHASNQSSVKEVAISVLVLKESIDMKGKPVKIFMTLATVDNESHLKALSSLVDIISEDEKLELIKKGGIDEIYEILKGGAK